MQAKKAGFWRAKTPYFILVIFMQRELDIAKIAALEAGKILINHYGRVNAQKKADGTDVTIADKESEAKIKSILSKEFPDYSFLGEETGLDDRGSEYKWVVDPLDGTTNYSMKNPFFNVSIALVKGNEPVVGVVYSPIQDELFHAVKGSGAFLNDERINVSSESILENSVVAFCHARGDQETVEKITKVFHGFKSMISTFRQMGAAALELAYVASGRIDAFIHLDLKPWDVAAGVLIIREAGGMVTNFSGKRYSMESMELSATNIKLNNAILETIKKSIGEKSK